MAISNAQETIVIRNSFGLIGGYPAENTAGQVTIGMIKMFGGDFSPFGAPEVNGQLVGAWQFPQLKEILGNAFGEMGENIVKLPDLGLGVSVGTGYSPGGSGYALGQQIGWGSDIYLNRGSLPASSGGNASPIDNSQSGQAITYLIRTDGSTGNMVGEVVRFAGDFAPGGYMKAQGQVLTIAGNEALFQQLGTTYGGDGVTTFALPDLRGRNVVGADDDTPLGTKVGSQNINLRPENLPVEMGGSGVPLDNKAPGLALTYIIATSYVPDVLYPARDGDGYIMETGYYIGEIVAFAGTQIPEGWLPCDGRQVSIGANAALFSVIETTYGGDGVISFNLPDLRGRVTAGTNGSNPAGTVLGSDTFTIPMSEIPQIVTSGTGAADVYYGGNRDDRLSGSAGDDTLTGNGGNDVLDGGTGVDTMKGGLGDDVYRVDDANDAIVELAGEGTDVVEASASYQLKTGVSVETLRTNDAAGTQPIDLTGNELSQTIIGNAGRNWLHSGGYDNPDRLEGGAGNDTYSVYNAGDVVVEGIGGGIDKVAAGVSYRLAEGVEVEKLTTTSASGIKAINLTGNTFVQTIVGNDGKNILHDGGLDAVTGTTGADTLIGRGGNDTYIIYNSNAVIVEVAGEGIDRVATYADYTLAAGVDVEFLNTTSLHGISAINLTGNSLAQTIRGNDGTNRIDGGGGADTLFGGGGIDTFVFSSVLGSGNVDTIADFMFGERIELSSAVFQGLTVGALTFAAFHVGTEATTAEHRIIFDVVTGALSYDEDGAGGEAAIQFAVMSSPLPLLPNDFFVV